MLFSPFYFSKFSIVTIINFIIFLKCDFEEREKKKWPILGSRPNSSLNRWWDLEWVRNILNLLEKGQGEEASEASSLGFEISSSCPLRGHWGFCCRVGRPRAAPRDRIAAWLLKPQALGIFYDQGSGPLGIYLVMCTSGERSFYVRHMIIKLKECLA